MYRNELIKTFKKFGDYRKADLESAKRSRRLAVTIIEEN